MMNTVDNHTRLLNPRIRFDKIAVRFFAKALDVDPGRLKAEPYSREHSDPDGSATDPGDFAGVTNGAPSGLQTEHASVAEQRLNYQPWITATLTAYGESLTGIKAGTVLNGTKLSLFCTVSVSVWDFDHFMSWCS
jgi:hypothetical protein